MKEGKAPDGKRRGRKISDMCRAGRKKILSTKSGKELRALSEVEIKLE